MARTPTVSDEDILEAAEQVIGRCGPDGFTLSEVALKVGLSRAAITLRFNSAQALKINVLTRNIDKFVERLSRLPKTPSGDNLLKFIAFISGPIKNRESFSLFYATYSSNLVDPELAALEQKRGNALSSVVSAVMPKTTIDHESAVRVFMASMTGNIIIWLNSNTGIDASSYLIRQTQDWLRLVGIPFTEGVDHRLASTSNTSAAPTEALLTDVL